MAYYIDLFSPETYEAFSKSDKVVSGVNKRQEKAARRVMIGDKLICYMTKLSRWVGILEVTSTVFKEETPVFLPKDDPFIFRFKVKPLVWLPKEQAIPIHEPEIWEHLSFTQNHPKHWTGKLRNSLNPLDEEDGRLLETLLFQQLHSPRQYPVDEDEYRKFMSHTIMRKEGPITVTVPQDSIHDEEEVTPEIQSEVRESIKMQAMLARIGAEMGMNIWIPRNDKTAVLAEWKGSNKPVLDILPLNYDETTLKTIEQIDVIWMKGKSIIRAFEVEHTTSIYSGILRMADLLALQPNMDIKLHIVAPEERRDKVFKEIRRPVFSLLEKGPLSESCTYLSYESIEELSRVKHLSHMSDTVLDEYVEPAE